MDEIDAPDQKFSMFQAAIAADLACYQRSSSDRIGCRSASVSSIGDDSVFSGDRESNAGDSVFQEGDFCEESIYEEEVDLNGDKIDEISHNNGRITTPEGFDEVVDP